MPGISYSSGATKTGPKGGTQVCLSIFSDFAMYHSEWANEKGTGWSPSYTAQVIIFSFIFFEEKKLLCHHFNDFCLDCFVELVVFPY